MGIKHAFTILIICGLTSPPVRADEVILKNGSRFEGRITREREDEIVLQTAMGLVTLRRSQIQEINRSEVGTVPEKKPTVDTPKTTPKPTPKNGKTGKAAPRPKSPLPKKPRVAPKPKPKPKPTPNSTPKPKPKPKAMPETNPRTGGSPSHHPQGIPT